MSLILDTSIVIPYLGNVAYDRFVWVQMARDQVYISSVTGMELLAGALSQEQRRKAEGFLHRLESARRIITPKHMIVTFPLFLGCNRQLHWMRG